MVASLMSADLGLRTEPKYVPPKPFSVWDNTPTNPAARPGLLLTAACFVVCIHHHSFKQSRTDVYLGCLQQITLTVFAFVTLGRYIHCPLGRLYQFTLSPPIVSVSPRL